MNDTNSSYATSIQSEIEKQQLTSVLTRLSASIESLIQSQKEMQAQDKLDTALKTAASLNPGNQFALDKMYTNARQDVFQSDIAPVISNIQSLNSVSNQNYQQLMLNQQSLDAWNAAQAAAPVVTPINASGFFQQAQAFGQQYQQAALPLMGSAVWGQYMGGVDTSPLYDRGLGSSSAYQNISMGMEQNYISSYGKQLGAAVSRGNPDTGMVQNYYDYQKSMFDNSQQMFLNSSVSNSLGVPGGAINRTEFEQGYMPALTKFGDVMGTDLSSSIGILKQLKDIHAIAAEINSGRTVDIAGGVDSALRVFKALSMLINSTDVNDLMAGVQKMSAFGAGNFQQGLSNVLSPTPGVVQSVGDRFSEVMSVSGSPYMQQYGFNRTGIEMSLFNSRATGTFGKYGDQDVNMFLGGAAGASATMTNLIGGVISNPYFPAASAGEGNIFKGAAQLGSAMSKDPYEYFIGQNKNRFDAMSKYSGEAGFRFMEYNMLPEASDFGLSKDQYLLAMSGGNPEAVTSYRKFKEARQGELYDKRKMLFNARQARDYLDTSEGMTEDELSKRTGGVRAKDVDWDYYASRGDSGYGVTTRNISNYFADAFHSNRARSTEDLINIVSYAAPVAGFALEGARAIISGDLKKALGGYEFKDKYSKEARMGYADSFNVDFDRKAGTRYIADVDFANGKSVMSNEDRDTTMLRSTLITALSTTVDRATEALQRVVESETGGLTEGEVRVTLAEAVNAAMADGSISGDDNRKLIQYIQRPIKQLKDLVVEQMSEDNPWVLLLSYYSNPSMARQKGFKSSGKNMIANSMRNLGMSTEQVNANMSQGSTLGSIAGGAFVGGVALGVGATAVALGPAALAGMTVSGMAAGGGIMLASGIGASVLVPGAKAATDFGTDAQQAMGEFFGFDSSWREKGVENFFNSGDDDQITREIKMSMAYLWSFLERSEKILSSNTSDSKKKKIIGRVWINAFDICTRVYKDFVSQNKPAVGAGKPSVTIPEKNIKEAADAVFKDALQLANEDGFVQNIENGEMELQKAVLATVALMLNPDSALFKALSSNQKGTLLNVKNAATRILSSQSFTSGDLESFSHYAGNMLKQVDSKGAVRLAMENVKMSNFSADRPNAEAYASMVERIGTELTSGLSISDQDEINKTLKSMGGVSGLADALKKASTGDTSALTGNDALMLELTKEKSPVRKAVESMGAGLSDMLLNQSKGKMDKDQVKREVEGMMATRMSENQKTVAVDMIEQRKTIELIRGVLRALSTDPTVKQNLDELGLT